MTTIQNEQIDPAEIAKWELSGGTQVPHLEMKIYFTNGNEKIFHSFTDETKQELRDAQNEMIRQLGI
jgi:hypothetical protein